MLNQWSIYSGGLLFIFGLMLLLPGLREAQLWQHLFVDATGYGLLALLLGLTGVVAGLTGERSARTFFRMAGMSGAALILVSLGAALGGSTSVIGLAINAVSVSLIGGLSLTALFVGFNRECAEESDVPATSLYGGSTFVHYEPKQTF